jgi:hypothetical protein
LDEDKGTRALAGAFPSFSLFPACPIPTRPPFCARHAPSYSPLARPPPPPRTRAHPLHSPLPPSPLVHPPPLRSSAARAAAAFTPIPLPASLSSFSPLPSPPHAPRACYSPCVRRPQCRRGGVSAAVCPFFTRCRPPPPLAGVRAQAQEPSGASLLATAQHLALSSTLQPTVDLGALSAQSPQVLLPAFLSWMHADRCCTGCDESVELGCVRDGA